MNESSEIKVGVTHYHHIMRRVTPYRLQIISLSMESSKIETWESHANGLSQLPSQFNRV